MNNVSVSIISSSMEKKATIVSVNGNIFGITKDCMPREEFIGIFKDETISNCQFVAREKVIKPRGIKEHLHKLSRSATNWNVRRLN